MDWKSPADVLAWETARATRKKAKEKIWKERWYPLLYGVASSATMPQDGPPATSEASQLTQGENETLEARNRRIGEALCESGREPNDNYIPRLVIYDQDAGQVIFSPSAEHATEDKKIKAGCLAMDGLEAKANRELACGLLGGEVVCTNGHHFRTGYECGNRYCKTCGPKGARKLFAQKHEQLFQVAQRLMQCFDVNCKTCYWFRKDPARFAGRLPHWPPEAGSGEKKPRVVVAKLDFTVVNTGQAAPDLMRELNRCIRRFCRAIERLGLADRHSYGLATCEELGAGNTNIHAHGIYVGPWLPQDKGKKQLSALWAKVTGYHKRRAGERWQGGFILSIKYADDFAAALYHSIKYPAKFAELARPERLAELEVIFHRVRRFHCFAAFYNPKVPKTEVEHRSCPICKAKFHDRGPWRLLRSRPLAGLQDLDQVRIAVNRAHALEPPAHPPP